MELICHNEVRSRNNCRGKSVSIIDLHMSVCKSECACGCPGAWACTCVGVRVALLILHVTRMSHFVMSFVARLAPPHFSTLSHKRHDFQKEKKLLNVKCVSRFPLQFLSKTLRIPKRT
jgi:hypothetical protein